MSELKLLEKLSIDAVETLSRLKGEPDWLREKRLAAFKAAEQLPLPSSRYTQIRGLNLEEILPFAAADNSLNALPQELKSTLESKSREEGLLVQIDSQVAHTQLPEALKRKGVIFTSLDAAIKDYPELVRPYLVSDSKYTDKFAALHEALWSGGLFLYVPEGVQIDTPLQALYLLKTPGVGAFTHTLIIAERGSRCTFLEELYSLDGAERASLHAGAADLHLKEGAQLSFGSVQNWGPNVFSAINRKAFLGKDAKMSWTLGWLGSRLTISRVGSFLQGEGATADDLQIFFSSGRQHLDLTSNLFHQRPHTKGEVHVRGVLKDKSRSVFQGLIRIEKGAQQSNAYQAARAMILNDGARADQIPGLEIEANDVRCTHAASTGQIDEEQVFYLKTRGLTDNEARKMIVDGFFEPTIERIPLPVVQERIKNLIDARWTHAQA